ncbi:MAG: tyrosine--tRNA ligase [Candidatus Spechtbacterales bacterium]
MANVKFTKRDLLTRGVAEIIEEESFNKRLKSGKKLRIKFGIDPTGPNIHLGHTVPLWKLRQFQDLGHKIVLVIGDFTATIGDPSGRSEERKVLSVKEVKENKKRYVEQVGKILDIKKIEILHNSEWHKKEGLEAMLQLARTATVQQLTERADFTERIAKKSGISAIELLYPLLQAYDSVRVRADVEVGGIDQKFNLLMGRQVQKRYGQKEQDIFMLLLLKGTDGVKKMSKSMDNYIALLDEPGEMFGKTMTITDGEIVEYFECVTPLPLDELEKIKKEKITGKRARDLKLQLAELVVSVYWGKNEAKKARDNFLKVFREQKNPKDISEIEAGKNSSVVDVLVKAGFASSKTEARRLVDQGGVYLDDIKIGDYAKKIPLKRSILRVGRRKIIKVVVK